jgi:hypothetical protein
MLTALFFHLKFHFTIFEDSFLMIETDLRVMMVHIIVVVQIGAVTKDLSLHGHYLEVCTYSYLPPMGPAPYSRPQAVTLYSTQGNLFVSFKRVAIPKK